MQNKPHLLMKEGNALFVHVPNTFTDEEVENYFNKNPETKLDGDVRWKVAPVTSDFPENRVACASGNGSWHMCLTMDGKPFVPENGKPIVHGHGVAEAHSEESDLAGKLADLLGKAMDSIPRPSNPHLPVDGNGFEGLTSFNWMGGVLRQFVNTVMRGSSLTPLQCEIIAGAIAYIEDARYCVMMHREAGYALAGGKDNYEKEAMTEKSKAMGAFSVMVGQGIAPPTNLVQKVKEAGWTDDGIHDMVLVVGVAKMIATYVEGLAGKTPNLKDEYYKDLGRRVAEKGYL